MAHSFFSEDYDIHQMAEVDSDEKVTFSDVTPQEKPGFRYVWPKGQWVIFHNNASGPNEPLTIVLRAIDGEELAYDDPRRVEIKLPFGLFAEFVGMRVINDKIAALEQTRARDVLGLRDQGTRCARD